MGSKTQKRGKFTEEDRGRDAGVAGSAGSAEETLDLSDAMLQISRVFMALDNVFALHKSKIAYQTYCEFGLSLRR